MPIARASSPQSITGAKLFSSGRISKVILLPSILKRNTWPNTQTWPTMVVMSFTMSSPLYAVLHRFAKTEAVMITSNSD